MSASANKEFNEIDKKYINPLVKKEVGDGSRVNGKEWKMLKDAFRIKTVGVSKMSSFEARRKKRQEEEQYKARLQNLKQEKEDIKNARLAELKRRKDIKEEKERYEKMAQKMHAKKVERLRKKEKRNKLLKERS